MKPTLAEFLLREGYFDEEESAIEQEEAPAEVVELINQKNERFPTNS